MVDTFFTLAFCVLVSSFFCVFLLFHIDSHNIEKQTNTSHIGEKKFYLDVVEVKPGNAVCIIETDMDVLFFFLCVFFVCVFDEVKPTHAQ